MIFVALKKTGALEPGNGGANLGVGVGIVGINAAFEFIIGENFARRDDDFAAFGLGRIAAQGAQDAGDVLA